MKEQKNLLTEEELEQYIKEKEKIRTLIGQIGGKSSSERDRITNIIFFILLALLFGFDILRDVLHIPLPLPSVFSLELGILLISVKIIFMIARQARIDHFQFWMLNSIEFRLNNISSEISEIKKNVNNRQEDNKP